MVDISRIKNFYKGKKILVTGHTGFKGSWMCLFLSVLGARIYGISNSKPIKPNIYNLIKKNLNEDINLDIKNFENLKRNIKKIKPDIIFHLAAQSLVYESYKNPVNTFQTNMIGSMNILESLRIINKRVIVVMITSDKCYLNIEKKAGYKETDKLGGKDPYSASKASAEHVIDSFYNSFFKKNNKIKVSVARAGNVIGGGDWSDNRIIPDLIKSWRSNKNLTVRNPNSTRPWQHVLDPLFGYILLAYNSNSPLVNGQKFNFGPPTSREITVKKLLNKFCPLLPKSSFKIKKVNNLYEAKLLKLNSTKSKKILSWRPIITIDQLAKMTTDWYKLYFVNKKSCLEVSKCQIKEYLNAQKSQK